jgi:pyruvate dehydrogenase E2 component (dihydrolipoamide acetyltransferase)
LAETGETRLALNRIRRATAKAMSASAQVPQFTIESDVDVGDLVALGERLGANGARVGMTDLFAVATARALRNHPEMNSTFEDGAVVQRSQVNLGIAIALEEGLVAPCIEEADRLSLRKLAEGRRALAEAAQAGMLTPTQMLSTTFTISNLGPLGVRRFKALVTPPQAGILALGAIADGVVRGPHGPTFGSIVSVALSCDHRAIDGAPAARFLATLVNLLQEPGWLAEL